ncbi:MAG: sugar nucleotide-binding protein [Chitinivibrionales bacterium]
MRVVMTGITSIHGWPVFQYLAQRLGSKNVYGIRPPKMKVPDGKNVSAQCITDTHALKRIRDRFKPTHVVHAAGVCDLDVCEDRPQWAHELNAGGAEAIKEAYGDLPVLYLSTDLVFSGNNPPRRGYTESHVPDPVSVAGRTFAGAESVIQSLYAHCIIRLGLPIGDSVTGTKGAVDWIESRFKRGLPVTLFYDELRSCIECTELAHVVTSLLFTGATGIWHCGGPFSLSLFDIGRFVLRRGNYPRGLLCGISRFDEIDGPPRIGDVSLNSDKLSSHHLWQYSKPF